MATHLKTIKVAGREATQEEKYARNYTVPYRVQFQEMNVSAGIAATAPGIPVLYSLYEVDSDLDYGARVTRVHAAQDTDSPDWWNVSVEFRTVSSEEAEDDENPLERAPVVGVRRTVIEQVITGVVDTGNTDNPEDDAYLTGPVVNSAGELFDPQPTFERTLVSIRVTKNFASFDPNWMLLNDAVNSGPFWGFAARTLKLSVEDTERQFENGYAFWPVTFEFRYKKETWDERFLDHGSYYLAPSLDGGTKKLRFTNEDGSYRLGNLDGDGNALPEGQDPVFLRLRTRAEYDFAALGLGNLFS